MIGCKIQGTGVVTQPEVIDEKKGVLAPQETPEVTANTTTEDK